MEEDNSGVTGSGLRSSVHLPPEPAWRVVVRKAARVAAFFGALYFFLTSIAMMEAAFGAFSRGYEGFWMLLIGSTSNPLVGLFVGILVTSVIQSSSATTSMVVALVASKPELLPNAIPIVMGANIGTTVTSTLVSLGHITRKKEFRRAISGAMLHDLFNIITVTVLLPIELATHYLQSTASFLSSHLWGASTVECRSPLKAILCPVANAVVGLFGWLGPIGQGVAALVLALAVLFVSLLVMVKLMRRAVAGRAENVLDRTLGRAPVLGILVGLVLTAIIQSSSVTTSMLVPLAGAGLLSLEQVFPITLGANIGTTVTAILASLATGPAGLTIALVHFLFNATGVAIVYPFRPVRAVPMRLARWLAERFAESRYYALAYVACVFFAVPALFVLASRLF